MHEQLGLLYAVITTVFWGAWGAFMEIPEKRGFPATLGYSVWALTMAPCCLVALFIIDWQLEYDVWAITLGTTIGFLGAGGQLLLFETLRRGPAYLVFPIISMSPVVTVALSVLLLKESASKRAWTGILLALAAICLLSHQPRDETTVRRRGWLIMAVGVFLAWGLQAYFLKFAIGRIQEESIFFYMTTTAILLIPVAVWMTDFTKPINWGFRGPYMSVLIQILNSIGALCMVYAFRHGRAMIVSPLINAVAPVLTVIISLVLYRVIPHRLILAGMVLAAISFYLMAT